MSANPPKIHPTTFPYMAIANLFRVPYWVVLCLDCRNQLGIDAMNWLRKNARNKAQDIATAVASVRRTDI